MSIFQTIGGVRVLMNQRDKIKNLEVKVAEQKNLIKNQGNIIREQETKLYAKDQVIKSQCSENVDLYAENKEYKNIFNSIKKEILQTNNYNSVINIQNKLKSMLEVVSGKHF